MERIQHLAHVTSKTLVTGISGTGKTTLFNLYIQNAPQDQRFIFDHEGEIADRLGVIPARDVDELARQTAKESLVVYDPSDDYEEDHEEGFRFFCQFVFDYSKATPHTKLFCCDELQLLTGTNVFVPELQRILQTGRRAGLDFIACSQQPNEIHNRILNQMSYLISFHHNDPRVLDELVRRGFNADAIIDLKPGQFIQKDRRMGTVDFFGQIPLDGSI